MKRATRYAWVVATGAMLGTTVVGGFIFIAVFAAWAAFGAWLASGEGDD